MNDIERRVRGRKRYWGVIAEVITAVREVSKRKRGAVEGQREEGGATPDSLVALMLMTERRKWWKPLKIFLFNAWMTFFGVSLYVKGKSHFILPSLSLSSFLSLHSSIYRPIYLSLVSTRS